MKRKSYEKYSVSLADRKANYISTKNEPWFIEGEEKWYPDMAEAYDNFSNLFGVSKDNFILTNGCENAMRLALMFFHGSTLYTEQPGWQMADILGEACNYNVEHYEYQYNGHAFFADTRNVPAGALLYTTDTYNNLFRHENVQWSYDLIVDETYTMNALLKGRVPRGQKIVIGSFSKFCGPGYRLGYILFDKRHNDRMQLLREQYISLAACHLLQDTELKSKITLRTQLKPEISGQHAITIHPTYMTFEKFLDLSLPHKEFVVSRVNFYRVGIPFQKGYMEQVKESVEAHDIEKEIDCLTTVSINVTDHCNKKCDYCPHGQGFKPRLDAIMSVSTAKKIADRLAQLPKKPRVTISGMGEPFLNPSIDRILKILAPFEPTVITNGTITPIGKIPDGVKIVVSIHNMNELPMLQENWPNATFRNHDTASPGCELHITNRAGFADNGTYKGKCYCPFYKMVIDWNGDYLKCAEDWERNSRSIGSNVWDMSIEDWFTKRQSSFKRIMVEGGREFFDSCRNCNISGTLMGENSFEWYAKHSKSES